MRKWFPLWLMVNPFSGISRLWSCVTVLPFMVIAAWLYVTEALGTIVPVSGSTSQPVIGVREPSAFSLT